MTMVSVKNLTKKYGDQFALKNLSLDLEEAGQYAIVGASGSGKSTLLYLIGGLDRPDSGEIIVGGKSIGKLNDESLSVYRNKYVGFIFQFHFLLPSINCLKNTLLPAEIGGHNISEVTKRVENLSEHLGISGCLNKFPYQLSGGEQQRVNIVRALSLKPRLLLCDEPTGNLDSENSAKVTKLLKDLSKEFSATLAVVTHDPTVAKSFTNRFILKDGELAQGSFYASAAPPPPPAES